MSEAELLELAELSLTNCLTVSGLYITVTFGYLVVAYLAGKYLSRLQATVCSGIYFFFIVQTSITCALSAAQAGRYLSAAGSEHVLLQFWDGNSSGAAGVFIVQAVGIFASLYFMWDARHPRSSVPKNAS